MLTKILKSVLLLVSIQTAASACVDDELIDCARMDSIFSVCSDIDHAKTTCPKFCGLCNVVDGGWSDWTAWSVCDVSCNNGTQVRARTCTNPRPEHGGIDCVGQTKDTKPCYRASVCPVHGGWSTWNPWEACSQTCDKGIQRRTRDCSNPKPAYSGDHCFGINADSRLCNLGACADGGWSSWTSWSTCSSTSGVGIRSQSRSCTNPAPSHDGLYCVGDTIKVDTCKPADPTDCSDVKLRNANAADGIYNITLWKTKRNIQVYCDMTTDGGGWTVFQYRYDGSVDFYRNYSEYVQGFGNLNTEFWLGLDYVEEMAAQSLTDLRVDLVDPSGTMAYEVISPFSLSMPNYVIHLGNTTSSHNINNSVYSFAGYHNGHAFSARDRDMDLVSGNCAVDFHGAWWFNSCYQVHLNAAYLPPGPDAILRGLDYVEEMVAQSLTDLRVDLVDGSGTTAYEVISPFSLSMPNYVIHLGNTISYHNIDNSVYSFAANHNGHAFSAHDRDMDLGSRNCAQMYHGAWWFNNCFYVHLNGKYMPPCNCVSYRGIEHFSFHLGISLKQSKMSFRRQRKI